MHAPPLITDDIVDAFATCVTRRFERIAGVGTGGCCTIAGSEVDGVGGVSKMVRAG